MLPTMPHRLSSGRIDRWPAGTNIAQTFGFTMKQGQRPRPKARAESLVANRDGQETHQRAASHAGM
jgi:hypothetical protein